MSRYDKLSTEQLEDAVTAMAEISKGWSEGTAPWKTGQDQMHNEIDQVLTELEERRRG